MKHFFSVAVFNSDDTSDCSDWREEVFDAQLAACPFAADVFWVTYRRLSK